MVNFVICCCQNIFVYVYVCVHSVKSAGAGWGEGGICQKLVGLTVLKGISTDKDLGTKCQFHIDWWKFKKIK